MNFCMPVSSNWIFLKDHCLHIYLRLPEDPFRIYIYNVVFAAKVGISFNSQLVLVVTLYNRPFNDIQVDANGGRSS